MGNTPSVTSRDHTVLSLKLQLNKLNNKAQQLEALINNDVEAAKTYLAQDNKSKTLACLQIKTGHKRVLDQINAGQSQLRLIISEIEMAEIQSDIVRNLSRAQNVLKSVNHRMSRFNIDDVLDTTSESQQISQDMQNAMKFEEADVEAELKELQLQTAREAGAESLDIKAFPRVPSGSIAAQQSPSKSQPISPESAQHALSA